MSSFNLLATKIPFIISSIFMIIIRAVTEIISRNNNNTNKGQRGLENLGSQSTNDESNNIKKEEYNPNRKF
jgi:hypothetical protein